MSLGARYQHLFAGLLRDVEDRALHRELTAFWPQVGVDYRPGKGTLFVGQAPNGWGECQSDGVWFKNGRAPRVEAVRLYSESVVDGDECPLAWYEREVGGHFAAVMRRLASGDDDELWESGWSRSIAWSNLYKVAPRPRGNPGPALRALQFEACRALFAAEIEILRPARVVVLAGVVWFEGFVQLPKSKLEVLLADPVSVLGVGHRPRVVLAPHPRTAFGRRITSAGLVRKIKKESP